MADKKKPGVMMYFLPMREAAEKLDDVRLAQLFRAVLAYADPDGGTVPHFDDAWTASLWPFLKNLIDVDDARYCRRAIGNKYSVFCRWYRRKTGRDPKADFPRDIWEDMGCPSFSDIEDKLGTIDTLDTFYTNVSNVQNVSRFSLPSDSDSDSDSFSDSESYTKDVSPRITPPGSPPPPPTIEEVQRFCWDEKLCINPMKFYLHYESKGWTMKDWKATAKKWDYEDREKAAKAKGVATDAEIAKYVRQNMEARHAED